MKKYDLILYNGEDILDLRLRLLYNHVDYFIISEFNKNFQNKKKRKYFDINKFSKYKKKIIYKFKELPNKYNEKTPWEIEAYQRESLADNVKIKNRDMIILSDVDEIIDPLKLNYNFNEIERYELLNFRFYGNYINLTRTYWIQPLSTSYNVAKEIGLEALRASFRALLPGDKCNIYRQYIKHRKNNLVKKAGWHFSSLKITNVPVEETIKKKLNEYSHTEHKNKVVFNTGIINFKIKYGLDVNSPSAPHLWGSINEKIIKNKKILQWMLERNLFYSKRFNYIEPNFNNFYPYPNLFIRKVIILLNKIIYFIFYMKYIIKRFNFFK